MKELVTAARNIVNTEEIMAWLAQLGERYPALTMWLGGPVRKWVNKTAPTTPFVAKSTKGLPDWLKKAMDEGVPAENIVLDEALEQRIVPVLDYMNSVLAEKPDTNIASIGFDVAEKRSIEWHNAMAKKAETVNPIIEEDGALIVKDYGNGWTWRKLVGQKCLENEGESMGHCVGKNETYGYFSRILRDKLDIFSLRGPDNVPHVTIEANMKDMTISQIKGRANQAVADRYLPMVKSFLEDYDWNKIYFDQAYPIQEAVLQQQLQRRKPTVTNGTLKLIRRPDSFYDTYVIVDGDKQIGTLAARKHIITELSVLLTDAVMHLLATAIVQEKWVCDGNGLVFLFQDLKIDTWVELKNPLFKQALQVAYFGGAKVDWIRVKRDHTLGVLAAYAGDTQTTYINQYAHIKDTLEIALDLPLPQQNVVRTVWGTLHPTVLVDVQDRVRKLQAGTQVKHDADDETLLNSLLIALKQPDVAAIKDAYLKLKTKDEVLDSYMKQLGIPVSGRAINGIAAVLMCSLPIKNLVPFQRYVFQKPNLLTCWIEVLTKPDHILAGLQQYGLTDDAIASIVSLLRNEFLRLVPHDIDALDLELGQEMKVKNVMKWSLGHRQDAVRSKKLWSQV